MQNEPVTKKISHITDEVQVFRNEFWAICKCEMAFMKMARFNQDIISGMGMIERHVAWELQSIFEDEPT